MLRQTATHDNLASLDVLRGIAILSVLISHFWPGDFPGPLSLRILCGQFGVILFFFLSGFLMDRTYSNEPQVFPFVVRRSFRILPMYWLSILIIFATEPGWALRDVVSNAIFATGPMHVVRMSGVYWTLYIEVLFYATVPLLFFLGRRAILLSSYFVIGLFGALWLFHIRSSVAPHYLAYCYLGLQFGGWQRKAIGRGELFASVFTVALVSSILPILSPFPSIASPFLGAAPVASAILLYSAVRLRFRAKPIELLGDISYSVYLMHAIVSIQVGNRLLSYGYASWIAAVANVGFSLALSVITFVLVERPSIAVGRRIVKRWHGFVAEKQSPTGISRIFPF